MPEAEDELYVPQIVWGQHLIWRGEAGKVSHDEADRVAMMMAELLVPAVGLDGNAALGVTHQDGTVQLFSFDMPVFNYRSEFMTPLQQACQVISEMYCRSTQRTVWEPVVVSGDHVLWRPYWRTVQYRAQQRAIEEATRVMVDHLRPGAQNRQLRGHTEPGWDPCFEFWTEGEGLESSTTCHPERICESEVQAWRVAAELLATAEATVWPAPQRSPIVDWPDTDPRLHLHRQAA